MNRALLTRRERRVYMFERVMLFLVRLAYWGGALIGGAWLLGRCGVAEPLALSASFLIVYKLARNGDAGRV